MAPKLASSWAKLPPATSFLLPDALLPLIAKRGVKYGWNTAPARGKPTRFNQPSAGLPKLTTGPAAALARRANTTPLRTGALAIKKGMTALYDPVTGVRTPCTILQLERVQVIAQKTRSKNGYYALQVGSGWKHPSNVTKPELGHYAAAGTSPKRHVVEFKVKDESGMLPVGHTIGAEWFIEGQFVDARANCRGMGFEGGMKRHGFSGQPASHGNSKTHRAMGSSGPSQGSGSRVLPGKRMAGNMGGQQVTVQNLKVLKVDKEKGIVVVNGCVPGPGSAIVQLQDALKKPWPKVPEHLLAEAATAEASTTTTA